IFESPSFCDPINCRSNYPESHLRSNRIRISWRIRDELIKWLSIRYCLCSRLSLYVQRIPNSTFSKDQQFFLKNFPLHPDYACSMFCRFLFAESAIVNGIKKLCNDLLCGCRKYWRLSIFIFSIRKKWVSNVEKC